jgi:hypothetical protein
LRRPELRRIRVAALFDLLHHSFQTALLGGLPMFNKDLTIAGFDDELWDSIQHEVVRQEEHIELIASENSAGAGHCPHQQIR